MTGPTERLGPRPGATPPQPADQRRTPGPTESLGPRAGATPPADQRRTPGPAGRPGEQTGATRPVAPPRSAGQQAMGDAGGVTGPTERLPRPDDTTAELPRQRERPGGPVREVSGALAIGVCGLALLVLGLQVYAWTQPDVPGPGLVALLGHVGAAVVAVLAQRVADRRRGPQAALAVLVVAIAACAALWYFWWA
ncbi:hypothetical protein [Actinokineospora sp. NPDC004072]